MKAKDRLLARRRSSIVVGTIALALVGSLDETRADSCRVETVQGGISFPVQHIPEDWACRLKLVIDHYTTANTLGPLKTAMDASMYFHLLDHPPLTAALINRLDLADYKAEMRGPGRWWGNDGESTEDGTTGAPRRDPVYILKARRGRLLNVSGKAFVFSAWALSRPSGLGDYPP
jgi:hypothetical protein